MFTRFPSDTGSSNDSIREPAVAESDIDSDSSNQGQQNNDERAHVRHTSGSTFRAEHTRSIVQMAFLELMTRRVMEAMSNCPDAVKLMNASVRKDID